MQPIEIKDENAPEKPFLQRIREDVATQLKFLGTTFFVLCIIVFILGLVFARRRVENNTNFRPQNYIEYSFQPANATNDKFVIVWSHSRVDPSSSGSGGMLNIILRFYYPSSMATPQPLNRPQDPIQIFIEDHTVDLGPLVSSSERSLSLSLTSGSVLDYPWDEYEWEGGITAFSVGPGNVREPLAFKLFVDKSDVGPFAVGITYRPPMVWMVEGNSTVVDSPGIRTEFFRPGLTKTYPMVVVVGMWAVIICVSLMLHSFVINRWRKTDNPTLLSFLASLIFALPAFRRALPFDPPLGIYLDYASFFWAQFVTVVALLAMGIRFYLDTRPAEAAKP